MVKMDLKYEGDLRVQARHQPSGSTLHTDAPVDNEGKGESFSPTDLVATGLGSCMATIMGIVARRDKIDLIGMELHVEKIMSTDAPRRIAGLNVVVEMPQGLSPEDEKKLEKAALACPVTKSIHPDIDLKVDFRVKGS